MDAPERRLETESNLSQTLQATNSARYMPKLAARRNQSLGLVGMFFDAWVNALKATIERSLINPRSQLRAALCRVIDTLTDPVANSAQDRIKETSIILLFSAIYEFSLTHNFNFSGNHNR